MTAYPMALAYKKQLPQAENITTRKGNLADTIRAIGETQWVEIKTINDLQGQFDVFYETLNAIQDHCQPITNHQRTTSHG